MPSNRQQNLARNNKIKDKIKSADDFINKGSDSLERDIEPVKKRELTKPVSISLTDTDKCTLDGFATRMNFLLLDAGEHNPKSINRSDLVKALIVQLGQMTHPELVEFYKKHRQ